MKSVVHDASVLSPRLANDVYLLANEALVNVARHASASSARLEVRPEADRVLIVVEDDGVGFRFSGFYDHEALATFREGPKSLLARVEALGGRLSINSRAGGATVAMTLPVGDASP